MNSKILSHIKKVIIASAIIVMCGTNAAYAFSFGGTNKTDTTNNSIMSLINKLFNLKKEEYKLTDFQNDLEGMQKKGNIDVEQIKELFDKLPSSDEKDGLSSIIGEISNISNIADSEGINIKELLSKLLDTLINAVKGLISGIGVGNSLPVEPTSINMTPATATEFVKAAGLDETDYDVNLHASVYMHVDENGKPDSDKWAFLIHPNSYNGEKMANIVGPFYYEKGYNIFAPDLRGAGDSEGEVSLGFLDSLDVYDWLTKLNNEYNVKEVIVHGISLGGATTNFLSGIDGFMNNGPTKINTTIKSIRELNVVGLVEDCGYTDMKQFVLNIKSLLIKMGIGLTKDNVDYYSDATNSLKYCDLPMLIIHGTKDILVKVENADTVKNTVKGEVDQWLVEGKNHAFIIMGQEEEAYREHVHNFIKYGADVPEIPDIQASYEQPTLSDTTTEDGTTTEKSQEGGQQDFLTKLKNLLSNWIK